MPGDETTYRVVYHDIVMAEDIPALPKTMRERIKRAVEQRLMQDPIGYGKPLRYSLQGHRRLRVGDYRVIYRVDPDERTVFVVTIKHRKDIYS